MLCYVVPVCCRARRLYVGCTVCACSCTVCAPLLYGYVTNLGSMSAHTTLNAGAPPSRAGLPAVGAISAPRQGRQGRALPNRPGSVRSSLDVLCKAVGLTGFLTCSPRPTNPTIQAYTSHPSAIQPVNKQMPALLMCGWLLLLRSLSREHLPLRLLRTLLCC